MSRRTKELTHGSLFAGIGGFDLGFERANIKTLWQVENDPYCLKVLERHWPDVQRYGDIKKIRWEDVEVPDIVSGGFPCQPVSVAGKRKGTEDERWLWPEFARCLRVLRPRYAVLENVRGLLALGFGDVLGDLAGLGYDAEWDCIPAAAFGAPHLRYRVWVVAYAAIGRNGEIPQPNKRAVPGCDGGANVPNPRSGGRQENEQDILRGQPDAIRGGADVADALGNGGRRGIFRDAGDEGRRTGEAIRAGVQSRDGQARTDNAKPGGQAMADAEGKPGEIRAAQAERQGGLTGGGNATNTNEFYANDGGFGASAIFKQDAARLSRGEYWATEPDVGRVANGIPSRVDRFKCLGNSIVPQVAEWLAKGIIDFEKSRVY